MREQAFAIGAYGDGADAIGMHMQEGVGAQVFGDADGAAPGAGQLDDRGAIDGDDDADRAVGPHHGALAVDGADLVCVLDAGRVAAFGPPDELAGTAGYLADARRVEA